MSGGNGVPRAPARPPMWRDSADVNFVRAWSGGKDGDLLDYLERFERSLTTKRMISADDMQALSQVQFAEGPVFVLALVEAHLSSPPRFATPMGESTLMTRTTIGPSVLEGRTGRRQSERRRSCTLPGSSVTRIRTSATSSS